MPTSKKPRKAYKPKAVNEFPLMLPQQRDNLAMPIHTAVMRANMGLADEEDFHTVAAALNVAYVAITNKGGLPQSEALLASGLDQLRNCGNDLNKVHSIRQLAMAVDYADKLNAHITKKEFNNAVSIVMAETVAHQDNSVPVDRDGSELLSSADQPSEVTG